MHVPISITLGNSSPIDLWRFRSIDPSPPRFIGECFLAHRTIHAAHTETGESVSDSASTSSQLSTTFELEHRRLSGERGRDGLPDLVLAHARRGRPVPLPVFFQLLHSSVVGAVDHVRVNLLGRPDGPVPQARGYIRQRYPAGQQLRRVRMAQGV